MQLCLDGSESQGSVILAKGDTTIKIQLKTTIETNGGINFEKCFHSLLVQIAQSKTQSKELNTDCVA